MFAVRHLAAIAILALLFCASVAQATDPMRVGAAKLDVTPRIDGSSGQFIGVLDPLFVRAVVIESEGRRAALVTVDAGAIGPQTWDYVSQRAATELAIPAARLMLTATHTHSAPFVRDRAFEDRIVEAITNA